MKLKELLFLDGYQSSFNHAKSKIMRQLLFITSLLANSNITLAPLKSKVMQVEKIISGGQTGIDQLGLKVAKELGIPTGGTAPKGFRTELGPYPSLGEDYGLVESAFSDYGPRTLQNVLDSDGTVLFGEMGSTGSRLTISLCKNHNKPYILNPTADELRDWLKDNNIKDLNVAGNRGSNLTTGYLLGVRKTLKSALS